MKKPKIGTKCEIRFKGWLSGAFFDGWRAGEITGCVSDLHGTGFAYRINVTTEDWRVWEGCSPECVRVGGKTLR